MTHLKPLFAITVLAPALVAAQLPTMSSKPGILRIEFGGAFSPADREFADGRTRDIGAPLGIAVRNQATSPMVSDLMARIAALTGETGGGGSIGSMTADLAFQNNTGNIGLALGITSRLTGFANIPIVSVRTEARLVQDAEGATLGLNPALDGDVASGTFVDEFDAAVADLRTRIEAGEYLSTPGLDEAAREWFANATELGESLANLLSTEGRRSAVLPLAGTDDAAALLSVIESAKSRFTTEFGVAGWTTAPAFPTTALTTAQLVGLLDSPDGFAYLDFDTQPLVALGDIELGLTYQLHAKGHPGDHTWSSLWVSGSGTLATGTAPRQNVLRDQGTGDRQSDLIGTATGEIGHGGFGLRAELSYRIQQATDMLVRVGNRDEFLRPASRVAALTWNPGNVVKLTARPFVRLARNLAIAGSVSYLNKGTDSWSYVANSEPASGGDPATMGNGTEVSAVTAGLGLSYSHSGRNRYGVVSMPVEAGLSFERNLKSSSGLLRNGLTTRVWFRVSKKLF